MRTRSSAHHLLCGHHDGLDGEFAPAHVKEVLERWAKEVDDKDVVQSLLAKVVDLRNTWTPCQDLVCAVLISQLWCVTFARFL